MSEKTDFKESNIGKIPEDWDIECLTDVIAHIVDNRGKTAPTVDFGIPLIATNCIKEEGLYPTKERLRFVSQNTYDSWFRDHPLPGDIIIVNKGTPGNVCIVPDPVNFCIAQDMVAIRPNNEKIYGKYLFAYMRSKAFKSQVDGLNVGTTIPHLKKTLFSKLLIPIPCKNEQILIGDMYYDLSEKIELNRQMNETLEAMTHAIFKSWFVDFDPVRAKAEGRDTGLPEEIADPFPDSFEETELGEMPKGWEICTIADLVEVVGGSTPSTKEPAYWDDGIHHWATPKDLSTLSVPVLLNTERLITDDGLAQISSGLLPKGTILLSSRAPIGYLAVTELPLAINQGFIAMKPKKNVSNLFILFWVSSAHEEILSRANGSTFLEISKSSFRPIPVLKPTIDVMNTFDRLVRPLYEKIVECEMQSNILIKTRDTLLPMLISGKLQIDDIEQIVENISSASE